MCCCSSYYANDTSVRCCRQCYNIRLGCLLSLVPVWGNSPWPRVCFWPKFPWPRVSDRKPEPHILVKFFSEYLPLPPTPKSLVSLFGGKVSLGFHIWLSKNTWTPSSHLNILSGKNIERHTVHTIVSWPNPKQWVIVHTSDMMMMIRQSIYILSIITKEMGKLKTHNPTYCIMDNWENMLNLTLKKLYGDSKLSMIQFACTYSSRLMIWNVRISYMIC